MSEMSNVHLMHQKGSGSNSSQDLSVAAIDPGKV